jgi:hypothetical protein
MIRDLIHKLGGPVEVAAWCSPTALTGNAVKAWHLRNHVPRRWRVRVRALAKSKGVNLTAAEEEALSLE